MTNDRDRIDAWLERDVTPLMPRPGSLDQIRRTARRRKTTQVVMAAAGCAVIIAAGVAVPQLTGAFSQHGSGRGVGPQASASSPPASAQPSSSATSASSGAVRLPGPRSYLSATGSGTAAPVSFRPTSVTFVGTGTGQLVGAVIGQAGNKTHPCATQYCTSLAGTSNYATSWYGVSAPLTGGPDGDTGVSQLRFANLRDGWAFGPALWETSNGGWPWYKENTYGMRVVALEASGQRAFAVFASCTGTGADYAADCTSFSLYSSVPGSRTWTPVAVPTGYRQMSTTTPSAVTLAVAGSTAYLLAPNGALLRGATSGGAWTTVNNAPCSPGAAQASGLPVAAQITAWPTLVLACDAGHQTTIFTLASGNGWRKAGALQTSGAAASLTSAPGGLLALATTAGIYYSGNEGASWQPAIIQGAPAGGFSYVGMTTQTQGVAVPADAALGEIFVTTDSGHTWTRSPISGP